MPKIDSKPLEEASDKFSDREFCDLHSYTVKSKDGVYSAPFFLRDYEEALFKKVMKRNGLTVYYLGSFSSSTGKFFIGSELIDVTSDFIKE